ncbi:MAG TPA: ABC transporter ATP-binding protein [Myxococcaceae bacterium]|nr:ABC transporter ATP-binding protein [Myxococcaceae bacterium]
MAMTLASLRPRALEGRDLVVVREGRRILDGASLVVAPGEAVAIQGPSGSGKSTLVRTLATLIDPDGGQVLLGGEDAHALAPTWFRTHVAYLAQQPALFPGTVKDNLATGPALHGREMRPGLGVELLAAVQLPEEFLRREASTLSGGEKQRVALARALANEPEVLLLDEPTAALDPDTGVRIVALVKDLSRAGRSVVMVTHDEAHARALGGTQYRCQAGRVTRSSP